jgi:hypothetical protein
VIVVTVTAPARRLSFLALSGFLLTAGAAWADPASRSVFPGRRVGGGSRGDCSARMLAHLVPPSSEYSPASDGLIGLVEGQAASPRPLALTLKPLRSWQSGGADGGKTVKEILLSPEGASVRLLRIGPVREPLVWESAYLCGDATSDGSSDPLAYIQTISPPALSLLKPSSGAGGGDRQALQKLAAACGSQVSREQVVAAFGLQDMAPVLTPTLPVRCE